VTIIDALRSRTVGRLFGKRSAFLLGPQPLGHLEFLPKLAHALVSYAINYVNVFNYKKNYKKHQVYQQEYGLTSQEAQDEQYSNPNINDNSLFTIPLDFERFPFVELGLINAGKIGNGEVLNFNIQIWLRLLRPYYRLSMNLKGLSSSFARMRHFLIVGKFICWTSIDF
jgi:hypothetical protein